MSCTLQKFVIDHAAGAFSAAKMTNLRDELPEAFKFALLIRFVEMRDDERRDQALPVLKACHYIETKENHRDV